MKGKSFSRSRIILADDHKPTPEAVQSFLQSSYAVVGLVTDGHSLVAVKKLIPDVAVLDVSMPRMTGLEAAKRVREMGSTAKVVFLTLRGDSGTLRAAVATGALGHVLKHRLSADLPLAIEAALVGSISSLLRFPIFCRKPLAFRLRLGVLSLCQWLVKLSVKTRIIHSSIGERVWSMISRD